MSPVYSSNLPQRSLSRPILDAENQYRADDVEKCIASILAGEADLFIGDRDTDTVEHFSTVKKSLHKLCTVVVRKASGISVADYTSGFRVLRRKAAGLSFIHNRFSYKSKSVIHAGRPGFIVENVKLRRTP